MLLNQRLLSKINLYLSITTNALLIALLIIVIVITITDAQERYGLFGGVDRAEAGVKIKSTKPITGYSLGPTGIRHNSNWSELKVSGTFFKMRLDKHTHPNLLALTFPGRQI